MHDHEGVAEGRASAATAGRGHGGRRGARRAAPLAALVVVLALVASACIASGEWAASPPAEVDVETPAWVDPDDPMLDDQRFHDVSCPTADFCMAIGVVGRPGSGPPGTGGAGYPIVQVWDGATWTEVEFTSAYADVGVPGIDWTDSGLEGVSCLSPTSCWVGVTDWQPTTLSGGMYHWDGSDLTVDPRMGSDSWVDAFDCAPDGSCLVVMPHYSLPAIWPYDGEQWLTPAEWDYGITSVACASGSQCLLSRTEASTDLVYLWEGAGDIFSAAVLDGPGWPVLDMDCPVEDRCILVGEADDGEGGTRPAVAVWDGTTVTERPVPVPDGGLAAVSCAQLIECVAVGADADGAPIALYSHNAWDFRETQTPPAATGTVFDAISCAPQVCVAVGWIDTAEGRDPHAATYRWDPWPAEEPGAS